MKIKPLRDGFRRAEVFVLGIIHFPICVDASLGHPSF